NILRLLKDKESLNQRTLATQMGTSAQAVSEAVKKLVQCGYVTKVVGTQNNENRIALTAEGQEVAEKLDRRIKSHASVVLGSFSQEELMELDRLLTKLL
ncbi:MAG: winged helix-turn-helix transcriptional regulator, partial [Eubacteriales bacterium]